jgi:hypothetical protein
MYKQPDISSDAAATIIGSKIANSNAMTADVRVYLIAVDGILTGAGPFGWDNKMKILPGLHNIEFGVATVSAFRDAGGFIKTRARLEAGKTYSLQATEPVASSAVCAEATGWIAGDDGTPITEKIPVVIQEGGGAEIPIAGGGFVSLPSHVHCAP